MKKKIDLYGDGIGSVEYVDHMGDDHALLRGLFDKPVFVAGDHVHGDSLALAGTTKKVGQRGVLGGALTEKHDRLL